MAKVITVPEDNIDTAEPYDIVKMGDKIYVVHEVTATDVFLRTGEGREMISIPRNVPGIPKPWYPMKPGKTYKNGDQKMKVVPQESSKAALEERPVEQKKTYTSDIPEFSKL